MKVNISRTFRCVLAKDTRADSPGEMTSRFSLNPFTRFVWQSQEVERRTEREGERENSRSLVDPTAIQMRRESGDGGNPPLFPPLTTS